MKYYMYDYICMYIHTYLLLCVYVRLLNAAQPVMSRMYYDQHAKT